MANRKPTSIASMIQALHIYRSGEVFTPREVYSTLHVPANQVTAALKAMCDRNELSQVSAGKYRKSDVSDTVFDLVYKRRLANPVEDDIDVNN